MHSCSADLDLPSETEFEVRTIQSLQHKDKFRLLKDARVETTAHIFVNLIGEVVKIHDSSYDHVSLYFTDYTSNPNFYNYVWGGSFDNPDEVQDEYGYLQMNRSRAKKSEWQGPFGTLTIQMTAFDAQANYIREKVKAKQWVLLTNVQIKYGRNGGLLEGFVRDREKTCVRILDPSQEAPPGGSDTTEGRLQEALKRKLTWTKKFQQQQKAIQREETGGSKRKHDGDDNEPEPKKLNSKQRRKRDREAAEKKVREAEAKAAKLKNLNQNGQFDFHIMDITLTHVQSSVNSPIKSLSLSNTFSHPSRSSWMARLISRHSPMSSIEQMYASLTTFRQGSKTLRLAFVQMNLTDCQITAARKSLTPKLEGRYGTVVKDSRRTVGNGDLPCRSRMLMRTSREPKIACGYLWTICQHKCY